MKKVRAIQDVYPAVEEIIVNLSSQGNSRLAEILHHRMHVVAWTSGSELLEELQNVLLLALESNDENLSDASKTQIKEVLDVIGVYFDNKR
jgi:hypothetical protein